MTLTYSNQQQIQVMTKRAANIRYLSDEEDDDEFEKPKQKKKENYPRFIKNGIEGVDQDQIVVNLSKTKYDVIETVVEELGWVVERSKKSQKWDIMWTDYHIDAQDLFKLNDHQKISHFPAIEVLSKKNFLGRSLMKMAKIFPKEYSFFPPTWSVPSELGELMRFDSLHAEDEKTIYIFKPEAGCQGKGISLLSDIQQIEGRTGIVQTYINEPFLIDGLKFDMRLYILIYGADPIRIYLYEEGLARFATEPYSKAKKKNLKETYVHLTNYAINKTNKKFIFNTSQKSMHIGHKRSLTSIFNLLKQRGVDVPAIKTKIDQLIVKTLLVGKPTLNHLYGLSQTDNLANDHCFHILGFDVMLDQNLQPFLLQVNHTPSFATDTPLDKSIKKGLIKETLLLLNVNLETKKMRIQRKKDFDQKRAMRKLVKLTPEERLEQKRLIEIEKNQYEQQTLKRYRKLYPLSNNQFAEFQECAQKIFNEQYGLKNKEQKQILSPLKPPSKGKSRNVSQIASMTTIVKKANSQISNSSIPNPQSTLYSVEKLPNIKKKGEFEKKQTLTPQQQLKNNELNPETIFAQFKQKITYHQNYIKQRLINLQNVQQVPFLVGKSNHRKQGGFIEPRVLSLSESLNKPSRLSDDISIQTSTRIPKQQKKAHRNYLDFLSFSTRQKESNIIPNQASPVVLHKKDNYRKHLSNRLPNKGLNVDNIEGKQLQGTEYLFMKSLIPKN